MLLLTALLHAILLLGVTFTGGVGRQLSEGLEVLLVTEDMPESAENSAASYLAQRTQKGTGNAPKGSTSAPQQTSANSADSAAAATLTADGEVLRTTTAQPQITFMGVESVAENRVSRQQADASRDASGLGAGEELVLRGDPNTGQWLSPDTRAYNLAPYLDSWRRKVERLGTIHYPNAAKHDRSASAPVIEVAMLASGKLQGARVLRSSGDAALDQSALDILRLASPFPALPAALAREYRILRFAYQWEFSAGTVGSGSVTAPTEATLNP
jgi:periplasmic protein TonB